MEKETDAYVLITPARNEVQFIEETLKAVVAQTLRPLKWIIVSDGSTDGTDELVGRYASDHDWIELIRMPERRERSFAGKVMAFNAGYERLKHLTFSFIGSLDADISFDEDYFAFLTGKLRENKRLGVVGTPFRENSTESYYDYRFVSLEHVSGACQFFRRECFEDIGGYVPMKGGGIDHAAVLTARMKGWETRSFPEKMSLHHRSIGTANHGWARAKLAVGKLDYALGGHPIWELFRAVYQMSKTPPILGGMLILWGYCWSALTSSGRPISEELVLFRRREQMRRLKGLLCRPLRGGRPKAHPANPEC
jgi:glycosyltransferase involved in cell wall biosynthesis